MPFHTRIKFNDGDSKDLMTKEEPEITIENGMSRITFFDENRKQILVRTDLIISIVVEFEETKNPFVSTEEVARSTEAPTPEIQNA